MKIWLCTVLSLILGDDNLIFTPLRDHQNYSLIDADAEEWRHVFS